MVPPKGKSGPGIIFNNSKSLISGFFNIAIIPSITSIKLCGGIQVAIPTAIPDEPLINKFGILVGNTTGSNNVSSKLGT